MILYYESLAIDVYINNFTPALDYPTRWEPAHPAEIDYTLMGIGCRDARIGIFTEDFTGLTEDKLDEMVLEAYLEEQKDYFDEDRIADGWV